MNQNHWKIRANKFFICALCHLMLFVLALPARLDAQQYDVDAFESSRLIIPEKFSEPPNGYRQHTWIGFNLDRVTEESMTSRIQQEAERDIIGGFLLSPGGGNTSDMSEEYLNGSERER